MNPAEAAVAQFSIELSNMRADFSYFFSLSGKRRSAYVPCSKKKEIVDVYEKASGAVTMKCN